jgi:RNA polymerase sigma-70 factor (ECF subfamily)
LDDQDSWLDFFDLYWRLLYNVARRGGLEDTDAQDVVQETVIAVAKRMPGFHYDPQRGSFKQWLLRISQRRIADHLRRLYRCPPTAELTSEMLEINGEARLGAEPYGAAFVEAWQQEWEQAMFDAAVAQVRQKANPKHFQVFDYCVLKGWPASKVAATLGLNAAQVYLAKHRVAQVVKLTARQLSETHSRSHSAESR